MKVITNNGINYEKVHDEMNDKLGNPYKIIANWLKIEIIDLISLEESMKGLRWIEKQIAVAKKEITSLKEYMEDLNSNKTTFKKIWRSITFRSLTV